MVVIARFTERSRIAVDSDWPVLLDGLLAGALDRRRPRPGQPVTIDLPLARYTYGVAAQWSWLASVGSPLDAGPTWAERWATRSPGPVVIDCVGVEWQCVGGPGAVRDLLGDVGQLGDRRASATVVRWDVVDAGPAPALQTDAVWLPSGHIARPIAARGGAGLGVPDAETVDGAVRPPYWRPPATNAGGTFAREWRPVIAPWTQRPPSSPDTRG